VASAPSPYLWYHLIAITYESPEAWDVKFGRMLNNILQIVYDEFASAMVKGEKG
jgi:hypothetical protein